MKDNQQLSSASQDSYVELAEAIREGLKKKIQSGQMNYEEVQTVISLLRDCILLEQDARAFDYNLNRWSDPQP